MSSSVALPANFYVRHPYTLWTDRRYLNKIVEIKPNSIEDGILQIQIKGAMDDLKGWLLSQGDQTYTAWTDISKTPLSIVRATSFATIAMLYAHEYMFGIGVVSVRPMQTIVVNAVEVSEYWFDQYENERQKYLDAMNRETLIVSTKDEDPVFTIEGDFGFYPEE